MSRKSWHNFYKNNRGITPSNIFLHWPYLLKILSLRPKTVLEIGCGTADHSIFLSHLLPHLQISLLDYDKVILARLKNKLNNKRYRFHLCNFIDEKSVKRNLSYHQFDVIYSQGVMEHFNINDFQKIVTNFLPYSDRLIFSVPSESYPNKDFGNELLRNKAELESIIKQIPNIASKVSSYFPDIGYRTKYITIKKLKLNLFQAIIFLLFGSCHYLIKITKKEKTY